jgi:hypothetical protein
MEGNTTDETPPNSVAYPEDSVTTLEQHEHVKGVEKDQVMKIQ